MRKQVEALNTRVEGASLRAHASRGAPDPSFPCPGPAAEIDDQTDKLNKEVADAEKEREKLQSQQADDQRGIARQQKSVERYLAKRQVLIQRRDECNKNIRDLGVLPEEAFNENTASSEKVRPAPAFSPCLRD